MHFTLPFSVLPASREQEGTESSEEGQLPQVVEELKDLQVAPGTRLAKFQLKVKGEGEGAEGQELPPPSRDRVVPCSPGVSEAPPPWAMWRAECPLADSSVLTSPLVAPGYPAPRLYWFKDGQPLTASAHIRMADRKTLHTLEILSVTSEDAGQYSAYISNTVGAAYSSARLLVRGGWWGTRQRLASTPG